MPQKILHHLLEPVDDSCKKLEENQTPSDESSTRNTMIKRSMWSAVKEFIHRIHWTSQSVNMGRYQPFADRAICLGNYGKIGKGLGEGISSHVYLLRTNDESFLAVKIFRQCKKRDNRIRYMKALVSEFAVAYTLNHRNILRTLDFVKMDHDPNKFGLVVDYCDQGNLNSLICQRELEPKEINSFFKQLLHGIQYLHEAGVAHRDLKPENLLLDQNVLKIADFGSCDVFRAEGETENKRSMKKVGTSPYMAPEIFTDQDYWGTSADIWSVAIILFCMHYVGVPFGAAKVQDSNYRHYLRTRDQMEYPSFNKLQSEPKSLLYSMLNPDGEKRPNVSTLLNVPWVKSLNPYCL